MVKTKKSLPLLEEGKNPWDWKPPSFSWLLKTKKYLISNENLVNLGKDTTQKIPGQKPIIYTSKRRFHIRQKYVQKMWKNTRCTNSIEKMGPFEVLVKCQGTQGKYLSSDSRPEKLILLLSLLFWDDATGAGTLLSFSITEAWFSRTKDAHLKKA